MDIQSSFSRLPEFVYFFHKQIQADNLTAVVHSLNQSSKKLKEKSRQITTILKELKSKILERGLKKGKRKFKDITHYDGRRCITVKIRRINHINSYHYLIMAETCLS